MDRNLASLSGNNHWKMTVELDSTDSQKKEFKKWFWENGGRTPLQEFPPSYW